MGDALANPLFSTYLQELFGWHRWNTRLQARRDIAMWSHSWYNQRRLDSAIRMAPPIECEQARTPILITNLSTFRGNA